MHTDKELILAAAQAAGRTADSDAYVDMENGTPRWGLRDADGFWNPLASKKDAEGLRDAVKIIVTEDDRYVYADSPSGRKNIIEKGFDADGAFRRAVTRAAAWDIIEI